jgi:multiple sugar transport system ATP-binding protein
MADIVIENAVKTFGSVRAVDNISLTIKDGEFVVLLGPSGCGKTTLLRAIAGLGMVDNGRITIGGKDVTYLPPKSRGISMVFQSYAIFPHMKVYDNIAFGLKMKGVDKATIKKKVTNAAELLHIENFLDRFPAQMSGGQRQRIAVARAIAYEATVLLMDEPLSNLDALLRLEMRAELKTLLNNLGTTTIYVTHDQIEALSMGDRIAVMRDGKVLQYDPPTTLYDQPADSFVGGFIGNPPMNYFDAIVRGDKAYIDEFPLEPTPEVQTVLQKYDDGDTVLVGIRAENMEALNAPAADALKVNVQVVEPLGAQNLLTLRVGNDIIKLSTHPDFHTKPGDDVWVRFPSKRIRWFDRGTGTSLLAPKSPEGKAVVQ